MASGHPNSSSAQAQPPGSQPYYPPAHPMAGSQPAAIAAASPPSKANLKSWWRGFKGQPKQTQEQLVEPAGIFGVPLKQSIVYANVAISLVDAEGKSYIYGYVPIVVAKCGVYLKEKATNVEGIFRLSGAEKRIRELVVIFNSPDRYGKGLDWDGYTVHDAANVLRRYLNQLPEPIVPLDLYERFREPIQGHAREAVGDQEASEGSTEFDHDATITKYKELITALPPLNRQLLLYILDLLAVFASKSDENRMTSQNLAAIFQPGMLSHPDHDMAPPEYRLSQNVLVFLIENQDHFLIGMSGTAVDEKTVNDVQNGATPPPATPTSKGVVRSSSNASAGADSLRRQGGVRRNLSVNSRHSRQSNGAPSPASPAYGSVVSHTSGGGVHRSNTVPSKKSPAIGSKRLQKSTDPRSPHSPFQPSTPTFPSQEDRTTLQDLSGRSSPGLNPLTAAASNLAPAEIVAFSGQSQDRLLSSPPEKLQVNTPSRERALFARSPTTESEKRQPNKLKKKRLPSSANPSAQSSQSSFHGETRELLAASGHDPRLRSETSGQYPTREHNMGAAPELVSHTAGGVSHAYISGAPVDNGGADLGNSAASEPAQHTAQPVSSGPSGGSVSVDRGADRQSGDTRGGVDSLGGTDDIRADRVGAIYHNTTAGQGLRASDSTLKPQASGQSLNSRTGESTNEASDIDGNPSESTEQKEKRRRWRLSRKKDETLGANLASPQKNIGANSGAATSTGSFGSNQGRQSFSNQPRHSFTGDTIPASSESGMSQAKLEISNDSGPSNGSKDEQEKKGAIGWLKTKMAKAKEEKRERDAEKEKEKAAKSLGPTSDPNHPSRGKSFDVQRQQSLPNESAPAPAPAPST